MRIKSIILALFLWASAQASNPLGVPDVGNPWCYPHDRPGSPYWTPTVFHYGSGSGFENMGNWQSSLGAVVGDTVYINPGVYSGFFMQNCRFVGGYVFFKAAPGIVQIVGGGIQMNNCAGLDVSNFWGHDIGHNRFFELESNCDSIRIHDCKIERSTDYMINIHETSGGNTTVNRSDLIEIYNDTLRGCGFSNAININDARTYYLSIHDNYIDSGYGAPGSASASISITQPAHRVHIYNNHFYHNNKGDTDHVAIMHIKCNGIVEGNFYEKGYYGNRIRARPYTIDSSGSKPGMDSLIVRNNGSDSALKYAFIEMQQFSADTTNRNTVPNVRWGKLICINNIDIRSNTRGYAPFGNSTGGGAGFAQVYDFWVPPLFANNACARAYMDSIPDPTNPPARFTFSRMFSDGGGDHKEGSASHVGDTVNNYYSETIAGLGIDSITLFLKANSRLIGAGDPSYNNLVKTGYRGNPRGNRNDATWDQFNIMYWIRVVPTAIKQH